MSIVSLRQTAVIALASDAPGTTALALSDSLAIFRLVQSASSRLISVHSLWPGR